MMMKNNYEQYKSFLQMMYNDASDGKLVNIDEIIIDVCSEKHTFLTIKEREILAETLWTMFAELFPQYENLIYYQVSSVPADNLLSQKQPEVNISFQKRLEVIEHLIDYLWSKYPILKNRQKPRIIILGKKCVGDKYADFNDHSIMVYDAFWKITDGDRMHIIKHIVGHYVASKIIGHKDTTHKWPWTRIMKEMGVKRPDSKYWLSKGENDEN